MSLLAEADRIYMVDGGAVVFDTDDLMCHELQTHTGSLTIPQRNWHSSSTNAGQTATYNLATAHASATFIYGRCKLTWTNPGSVPLPQGRWYDIGGDLVIEHLCFQDIGGNYASYPSAMYKLTFYLSGGLIKLDANSVLCNDFLVNSPNGWTAFTLDYSIHSATFT